VTIGSMWNRWETIFTITSSIIDMKRSEWGG